MSLTEPSLSNSLSDSLTYGEEPDSVSCNPAKVAREVSRWFQLNPPQLLHV